MLSGPNTPLAVRGTAPAPSAITTRDAPSNTASPGSTMSDPVGRVLSASIVDISALFQALVSLDSSIVRFIS